MDLITTQGEQEENWRERERAIELESRAKMKAQLGGKIRTLGGFFLKDFSGQLRRGGAGG